MKLTLRTLALGAIGGLVLLLGFGISGFLFLELHGPLFAILFAAIVAIALPAPCPPQQLEPDYHCQQWDAGVSPVFLALTLTLHPPVQSTSC